MTPRNDYRKIIQRLASDQVNERIPNGAPQHASILIETMFNHAVAEMRIFSKALTNDVYATDEIVDAAKAFFSKSYARLFILLQKKPTSEIEWIKEHKLLLALREIDNPKSDYRNIQIRYAKGSYTEDDANHFAVMDNDAFRYELDHNNRTAVANFNEPETAKSFIKAFDRAFDLANGNEILLNPKT